MGDFSDQDRMLMQETHTLLKAHVKTSDERHQEVKETLKTHESAIRKNTAFRNWTIGIFTTGGAGTGVLASVKHFFGGS